MGQSTTGRLVSHSSFVMSKKMQKTDKTTISRKPKRGSYDEEVIYSILDEGMYCTVAYCADGQPFQIPTGFVRVGTKLYIHGSVGSHMMREIAKGIPVCIAVTILDALVLARSVMHHSMNYRSVVMFGNAVLVTDDEEKNNILAAFTDKLVPGRWDDARVPTKKELDKTMVLGFEIDEASAKLRTEGVSDDEEDYALPVWAGLLQLKKGYGELIPDERMPKETIVPAYLEALSRS